MGFCDHKKPNEFSGGVDRILRGDRQWPAIGYGMIRYDVDIPIRKIMRVIAWVHSRKLT